MSGKPIQMELKPTEELWKFVAQAAISGVRNGMWAMRSLLIGNFRDRLLNRPGYKDCPSRLQHYEWQAHSQNGEDGIIQEIFRRIGEKHKTAFELGSGNGTENNTTYLLYKGWRNWWFDYDQKVFNELKIMFKKYIGKTVFPTFRKVEHREMEDVLEKANVPKDLDLAVIDVDGNDYWILKELLRYRQPRVLCVEYNALFRPPVEWIMPYKDHVNLTICHSASLSSFVKLVERYGYIPVGCDLTGTNAFFVGKGWSNEFHRPFTAENHHEQPRFFLTEKLGHQPNFEPWTTE